jgi:hypothetical protein
MIRLSIMSTAKGHRQELIFQDNEEQMKKLVEQEVLPRLKEGWGLDAMLKDRPRGDNTYRLVTNGARQQQQQQIVKQIQENRDRISELIMRPPITAG